MAKVEMSTLSQTFTIGVGSLGALDVASTGIGSDIKQDGVLVTARFAGFLTTDPGGIEDHVTLRHGYSQSDLTAAEIEEALEAIPVTFKDTVNVERAGRYVRHLGGMDAPYGDGVNGYFSNFDTGWVKVVADFLSEDNTILRYWAYNLSSGALDADSVFTVFAQMRVRWSA